MNADLVVALLGTSSITWLIQFIVTRHYHKKDSDRAQIEQMREEIKLIKETLAAEMYTLVSNEIERFIAKGYATSSERRALEILYDAYHANGWNGDMEARMEIVHNLPFRKEDKCS